MEEQLLETASCEKVLEGCRRPEEKIGGPGLAGVCARVDWGGGWLHNRILEEGGRGEWGGG